jgi:hypothetical protein
LQCYHIYGLWRLSVLRAIRYHYTHWWSDLPLMLAASAVGIFRHIEGPSFNYYEIHKTAEGRAAYQDNRSGSRRLNNFAALFWAILLTVGRTAGMFAAVAAMTFVFEKYVRIASGRVGRMLGLGMAA